MHRCLRHLNCPTNLAAKLSALLARGAGTIGASGAGRGVALEDGSVCAVRVNTLVSAEKALDLVAAALRGNAGALMQSSVNILYRRVKKTYSSETPHLRSFKLGGSCSSNSFAVSDEDGGRGSTAGSDEADHGKSDGGDREELCWVVNTIHDEGASSGLPSYLNEDCW